MDLITVYFLFQVSTHGYSQNQILVWKYPSLVQIAKLTGHTYRVLYLVSSKSFKTFTLVMLALSSFSLQTHEKTACDFKLNHSLN